MTSRFTAGLRILAIDPITKGLGFAVLEERRGLIHWGVRNAASGTESRRLFRHLLDRYAPDVLVLGDYRAWDARRPARVRRLLESLERLAAMRNIVSFRQGCADPAHRVRRQVQRCAEADPDPRGSARRTRPRPEV